MKKTSAINFLSQKSNGFYLAMFFVCFAILIIASLFLKGLSIYNGAYFTGKSITLLVAGESDSYIIRLDNQSDTLSALRINNTKIQTENLTLASVTTGVPLQGSIKISGSGVDIESFMNVRSILQLIMNNRIIYNQVNEYDVLKFGYHAQKIPSENRTYKVIKNYVDNRSVISQIDGELYELFRDPEIINERITVEVMNATSQSGLASAVAQTLENGGYTIVAIRSSDLQRSEIQTDFSNTVTTQAIKKIFTFPVVGAKKNSTADIRIIIGDDIYK